jgi:acyl phosphate:glycerol-3-phosphate acyltransferase
MAAVGLIVLGYVLGSIPSGYWISRLFDGIDIRTVGSGNPGATNVWRTLGWRYGVPVALLDIAKGFAAALLGRWLAGDLVAVLAGVAAMAGHWRPLFLRFARGGKIVATTGGVGFAVAPLATLAAVAVWWVFFLATRYVSIASMASAISLPLFAVAFDASWPVIAFTTGGAVAIVVLHRANIGRLFTGTERRAQLRGRGKGAVSPGPTRGREASL